MLLLGPAAFGFLAAPLLLLASAFVLEFLFGEARGVFLRLPHPVRVIGGLTQMLDRKLNRPQRRAIDLRLRGLAVALFVPALAASVGYGLAWAARTLPYGWALELLAIVPMLAQRSLYRHVAAVAQALAQDGLPAGRRAVAHIVGRDVERLDEHGVARAAIESCAENFSDAVVAPAFWYILLGLPGLYFYKAVNTLDSMIGHLSSRYRDFGMGAARFDDLLNLLPARLSGLLLAAAAAVVPTANGAAAMRAMRRDARQHASPNAGWPEAAMAGALDLALSGPRTYGEQAIEGSWLNPAGRADATVLDIGRALMLYGGASLLVVTGIGMLGLILWGLV
jgi:adenosylcobinamide-phosphate synthase